jgi:preprotein translocase subunit SecA
MKGKDKPEDWDWKGLFTALESVFPISVDPDETREAVVGLKRSNAEEELRRIIVEDARNQYSQMEDEVPEEAIRQLERRVVLAVLDRKWREHLYEMDYLKDGIGLRGMGQRDPLVEYQREGYQMYNSMIEAIKEETVQLLFHVDIQQVAANEDESSEQDEDVAVEQAETDMGIPSAHDVDSDRKIEASADDADSENSDDGSERPEGLTGPQPLSHADAEVPVSKRPKSEETHSPWADGRTFPGTSKNAPCPCGSGRKYKMCHGQNEH